MEEFWRPIIQEEYSAVRQPPIEANNFELKPALITMVQQHRFNKGKAEKIIRVGKGLHPLKIKCLISCQITKGF